MGDQVMRLPWGSEEICLGLSATWHVAGVLEPSPYLPALDDVAAEVERSLAEPVGSPRLREMVNGQMRIALVVDDGSRPTPVARLLPAVLRELEEGGACVDQITVVMALGLHRPMTEAEVAERIGADPLAALRWQNHDCDDTAGLAFLGTTGRGTPVYLNKTVAAADLIVSIGCIEPHIIASFGGGLKNLVPGVAGRATVAHNHSLNCTPDTFNMVGQPIDRNPMRLDLEEAAQMVKRPIFVVNAVLNSNLRPVRVVAGEPVAAHRAGVAVSASLYGVPVPRQADVVITDSHPMDQDLRQGVKALANTVRALKPGGVQITLVRAAEGVGVFGLANRKLPLSAGALRRLAPVLVRLVPRLKLAGMGEEDRFFLYFALQAMRRGRLLIYGPTIPATVQGNLPFVDFVPTPEAAIAAAAQRFPQNAEVLIFPHGGVTYPILG
jgi:nickel-dependent lactate racemase